jgi:hypothetical protein
MPHEFEPPHAAAPEQGHSSLLFAILMSRAFCFGLHYFLVVLRPGLPLVLCLLGSTDFETAWPTGFAVLVRRQSLNSPSFDRAR